MRHFRLLIWGFQQLTIPDQGNLTHGGLHGFHYQAYLSGDCSMQQAVQYSVTITEYSKHTAYLAELTQQQHRLELLELAVLPVRKHDLFT